MKKTNASTRARSNKAKGRIGEKEIQQLILKFFEELEPDDCRWNGSGSGGEDILLSPAARKLMPWNIEVKRKKKVGAARFMEQAGSHGDHEPVAFFREDRGPWYAVVDAHYLFRLVRLLTILDKTPEFQLGKSTWLLEQEDEIDE